MLIALLFALCATCLANEFSLVVVGHFPDSSGFGEEARDVVLGLHKLGVPMKLISVRGTNKHTNRVELPKEEQFLLDSLHSRAIDTSRPVIVLYILVPGVFLNPGTTLADIDKSIGVRIHKRIARAVFETDNLPENWLPLLNRNFDEVWVASEFNLKTFSNAGIISNKLRVVPEPTDTKHFSNASIHQERRQSFREEACGMYANPEDEDDEKCFVFLSVFDWQWRKGWNILLYAFIMEFETQGNVRLVIKPSTNFRDIERDAIKKEAMKFIEFGKLATEFPANIILIEKEIPKIDMPSLYGASDVFVLPTRGEGWGRPLSESMSMGLPIITTGWGGQTHFSDNETSYHIDFDLEEARDPNIGFYGSTGQWAKPNSKSLQRLLRLAYDDATLRAEKAARGLKNIQKFNSENVAREIFNLLSKIAKSSRDEL